MQASQKKFWSSSVLLLLSRTLAKLATIVVVVIAARYLGVTNFGLFNSILAISAFSGIISDFGLVLPTIRSIAKSEEKENLILSRTLPNRIILGAVACAIITVIGLYFNFPAFLVLLLSIASIFEMTGTTLVRSLEGVSEFKLVSKYIVVERLLYGSFAISSIILFQNVYLLVIAIVFAHSLYIVVAVNVFQKRFGRLFFRFSYTDFMNCLKLGFPFFLTVIFSAVYYRTDILLINRFCTLNDAGYYNSAMRIIEAQMMVPLTMMTTIFPQLSSLFHQQSGQFLKVLRRSLSIFLLAGVLFALITFFGSDYFIVILYSEKYSLAIPVLRILSIMLLFYFLNAILFQTLVAMHKEKIFTLVIVASALLSIAGNVYFLPLYGITSAAWTRVVIEIVSCFGVSVFLLVKISRSKIFGTTGS